jgi:hypothetical protein
LEGGKIMKEFSKEASEGIELILKQGDTIRIEPMHKGSYKRAFVKNGNAVKECSWPYAEAKTVHETIEKLGYYKFASYPGRYIENPEENLEAEEDILDTCVEDNFIIEIFRIGGKVVLSIIFIEDDGRYSQERGNIKAVTDSFEMVYKSAQRLLREIKDDKLV